MVLLMAIIQKAYRYSRFDVIVKGNMMTALFGLFVCIALDAPWYAYVIGFLCLCADSGTK